MAKKVVVVSTYVDELLKEQQPDVSFLIFQSLGDLAHYVGTTPIRADVLYLTKEVLQPSVNTALNFFLSLFTPFLQVDKIEYLSDKGSADIASVKYLIDIENLTNWTITTCSSLTREWVNSLISGNLNLEEIQPTRKAVYRVRKEDFLREQLRNKTSLDEKFPSDEERLSDIPDEEVTPLLISEVESICKIITITGINCYERTLFSFIMAQYLSFNGKTLIMEKDFDYLTLSDMATKSNVEFFKIDISTIYENLSESLRAMKNTAQKLIVVTASKRDKINYQFVSNLLYNNLSSILQYFVMELEMEEVASTSNYIAVIPNNVVDVIKTAEALPGTYKTNCAFVGVNTRNVQELNIRSSVVMETIIKDLLQIYEDVNILILNIASLKLGGEAHDLRMLIRD